LKRKILGASVLAALATASSTRVAEAHGFAGDRFFPATIATDDPFVADEMSLPTVTLNPRASDGSKETDIGVDLAKRITRNLGITFSDQWKHISVPGAPAMKGWDALSTGVQYQLFVNAPHELIGLVGLGTTWGHTGSIHGAGAPDFTTLTPNFAFGKGFGDLPQSLPWLRPFALTGNIGVDFPTKITSAGTPNANANIFNYGIALEYSLEFLQHHVRDVGLGAPFDRMIPVVELSMTTPFNRGQGGQTTGTVQPGVIWAGQHFQIGAEAILPVNSLSGHGIGGVLQFHLFLDDLFPTSIGKPLLQD
jgi:hypothetical protein